MLLHAQNITENWIKTTTYREAYKGTAGNPSKFTDVEFFDGLGRPKQVIKVGQAPGGGDIITHIAYDGFGRQTKEYLPYIRSSSSENIMENLDEAEIINFYQTTSGITHTAIPYSEKLLENSPLNRLLKQAAPGEDWKLGSGHEVKYQYDTNTAADLVRMPEALTTYDSTGDIYHAVLTGWSNYYAASQLYKNIQADENNSLTGARNIEFIDKTGKTVLKRFIDKSGEKFDTYYVYDEYDNLSFIIPPKASVQNSLSTEILNNLCYQYEYDHRNRKVMKKIPGKKPEYMIYDKADRLRAAGPVLSPFGEDGKEGWLFTKYDALSRPVYSLWLEDNGIDAQRRFTVQQQVDAAPLIEESNKNTTVDNFSIPYTNKSFPTADFLLLTVNYYDKYPSWASSVPADVWGQNIKINLKSLPTASWVRLLDDRTTTLGIKSLTIYKDDHLNSPVELQSFYPGGGYTITQHIVDFEGKMQKTYTRHKKDSNAFEVQTEEIYTYDPQGRLVKQEQKINQSAKEVIFANQYNILGRLTRKKVGGTTSRPLQTQNYGYNIRGWLTGMNDPAVQTGALFGFSLQYNSTATPLYNGNISGMRWKSASDNLLRSYSYHYDDLNRLREASYLNISNNIANTYDVSLSYDRNGNILSLLRKGGFEDPQIAPEIDDLQYTYKNNSNQLKKVVDLSYDSQGFNNGASGSNEDYTYDAYGNMITDANKGITGIKYNYMNLPVKIEFSNNRYIRYVYDAAGTKWSKQVADSSKQVKTEYMDGFQYKAGKLLFFPTAEGYVKAVYGNTGNAPAAYRYVYTYKDHLGNNRLSYTLNPATNKVEVLEENHYYPFGLTHPYNSTKKEIKFNTTGNLQIMQVTVKELGFNYKYNGKELQDELGLQWYEYGARNYDAALGRWMNLDPLAEEMRRFSPYVYAFNNPVYFIDPDGMSPNGTGFFGYYELGQGSGFSFNPDGSISIEGSTDNHENSDWKPVVDKNGKVSYFREENDGIKSLMLQYGLSASVAAKLYFLSLDSGSFSGDAAKAYTGSEILRLDLNSKQATEQRVWDQFIFARDYSAASSKIESDKSLDEYSFLSTKFFQNTKYNNVLYGHATMEINNKIMELDYEIPFYRSGTFDNSSTAIRYSIGPEEADNSPGGGTYYPHHQSYVQIPIYHPDTGNYMGSFRIYTHSKNNNAIWNRYQR